MFGRAIKAGIMYLIVFLFTVVTLHLDTTVCHNTGYGRSQETRVDSQSTVQHMPEKTF